MNRLLLSFVLIAAFSWQSFAASPRETATVQLIRKIKPTVVPVYPVENDRPLGSGTASIIHPAGFMLSNDHVSKGKSGLALVNGERRPYRVIGRLPGKDITLLQLRTKSPLPFIRLGRSHDLMTGEPTIAAGNPGGRGIIFTQGIVSAPSIMDGVNALMMSYFQSGRDEFVQFDAASNPGNSGGPLVNALGEQIGIVSSGVVSEENSNYAIPIDRVRSLFNNLLPVEVMSDFWTGIEIDTLADRAVVKSVAKNSPAAKAKIKAGDIITSLNGNPVHTGVDWILGLVGGKSGNEAKLQLAGKKKRSAKFKLVPYPLPKVAGRTGKVAGLNYEVHHGKFKVLPDFDGLKPAQTGTTDELATESLVEGRDEYFALVFTGYLDIPKNGVYRLTLGSDDGSKLFLGGKLLIDNDDNHPMQHLSRIVRMQKGLNPFRLEYFDYTGDAELELKIEGGLHKKTTDIPNEMFFRDE